MDRLCGYQKCSYGQLIFSNYTTRNPSLQEIVLTRLWSGIGLRTNSESGLGRNWDTLQNNSESDSHPQIYKRNPAGTTN